jgi:hypothetical protein
VAGQKLVAGGSVVQVVGSAAPRMVLLRGFCMRDEIIKRAYEAFRADIEAEPTISLRSGDSIDSYMGEVPYDPVLDAPTDEYLERYGDWSLGYLDAAPWRHYLPRLIDYVFRNLNRRATMVSDGLLFSLRPPDREPPRLATLTPEQESVVTAFLEDLAFSDDTMSFQEEALVILEEWWLPNARYRPRPEG